MTDKKKIDAITEGRNPLGNGDAKEIAEEIAWQLQDSDLSARLLLLCFAFTYERDLCNRESLYLAVREAVSPTLQGFDAFSHEAMRRQLEALKKGGVKR